MDLEEIIDRYSKIVEWIKKINWAAKKANIWQKTFVDGLELLYPLSRETVTIPTSSAFRSIIIAHRLWIYDHFYKCEVRTTDIDLLYQYKDEIMKNVRKNKRDALSELIILGKEANRIEDYRKIEKDVDINIFILREALSSLISQEEEHIHRITTTYRQDGFVSCECIAAKDKKYNLHPSRYSRNIEEIYMIAQVYEPLEEICRSYYEEVQSYIEPNAKIAQRMEDAVVQFKVAKKLSQ